MAIFVNSGWVLELLSTSIVVCVITGLPFCVFEHIKALEWHPRFQIHLQCPMCEPSLGLTVGIHNPKS